MTMLSITYPPLTPERARRILSGANHATTATPGWTKRCCPCDLGVFGACDGVDCETPEGSVAAWRLVDADLGVGGRRMRLLNVGWPGSRLTPGAKPRIIGSTWTSFGREWEFLMPDGSRRWVRETSYEYDRLTK